MAKTGGGAEVTSGFCHVRLVPKGQKTVWNMLES